MRAEDDPARYTWWPEDFTISGEARHLPGKHDQSTHGGGKTAVVSLDIHEVSAEEFRSGLAAAKQGTKGPFLSMYSVAEFRQMRCFAADEGRVGAAIKDHGDGRKEIVCLYNNHGPMGAGVRMLDHAIGEGGNYLECYGDGLRTLYEGRGFRVTGQFKFDPSLAQGDWDMDKFDSPDYFTLARS